MNDKQVNRRQQQNVDERPQQIVNDSRPANQLATGATGAAAAAAAAADDDDADVKNFDEADIDKPLHNEEHVRNAVTNNVIVARAVMNRRDVNDDEVQQKERELADDKMNKNLAAPVPHIIDKSVSPAPQHVLSLIHI